jgi:hypothetical protein
MTDKHPLHPKLIDALSEYRTCDEAMRAAADWQLKQVTKWLKSNTADYVGAGCYFLTESFLDDFKKAMRPTTTQENNQ